MFEWAQERLAEIGLPTTDAWDLPTSRLRFPDGGHYQIEAATVNTLAAAGSLLEELDRQDARVDQITHTFGIMRLTDRELRDWSQLAHDASVRVVMSIGPRGIYDTGAQKFGKGLAAHAAAYRLRGMDQIVHGLEDVHRALEAGITDFLIFDEGLLWSLDRLRERGSIPRETTLKASAALGVANPVHCRLLAELGADSINIQRDLELQMISTFRSLTNVPLNIHSDNPAASGGFIRTYQVPEIVRVAAPVYVKAGNSAVAEHDSLMTADEARMMAKQITVVVEHLRRHAPDLTQSAVHPNAPQLRRTRV